MSAIPGKAIDGLSSETALTIRPRSRWLCKDRTCWRCWLFLLTLTCGPALCQTPADELAKAHAAYRASDYVAAMALYRSLGENGSPEAQMALARMHREGKGTPKSDAQAVVWYRKAADQGHAEAQTWLGWSYEFGRGVSRSDTEAARWYRLAAEQNYAWAQTALGYMQSTGRGVARDDSAAVEWYRKAAAQNYAAAQDNLGVMYRDGRGVPRDSVEAVRWFRLAAERDYPDGQNNLGVMYQRGEGIAQDFGEAVRWYRKAADKGLARAQSNLGFMYEEGRGVEQDSAQAVEWFGKAAAQRFPPAQAALGRAYESGKGAAKDDSKAALWYELAARQGNATAQVRLAQMYLDGRGVDKDPAAAREWLQKASDQGSKEAQRMLGEVDRNPQSPQQRDRIATLLRLMRTDDSIVAAVTAGARTSCKQYANEKARQCEASAASLFADIDRQRLVELLVPFYASTFDDGDIEAMLRFFESEEGRALTAFMLEGSNWSSPGGAGPSRVPPMTGRVADYVKSPVAGKLAAAALPLRDDAVRKVGPYLCTVLEPRGFDCPALRIFAGAAAVPASIGMFFGPTANLQPMEEKYQREADIVRVENLVAWVTIIEAYHAKAGRYPLQSRVKGEEVLRVRIATREQQVFLDSTNPNYDRATALEDSRLRSASLKDFVADIESVLGRDIEERYDPQRVPNGAPIFFSYFVMEQGYVIWSVCRTCPSQSTSFTIPLILSKTRQIPTINIGSAFFIKDLPNTQSVDSLRGNKEFIEFVGEPRARSAWFDELRRAQVRDSKN